MARNNGQKTVALQESVAANLEKAGTNLETELLALDSVVDGSFLPRIKVHHSDRGKHKMVISLGESYLDQEDDIPVPGNKLIAVVWAYQDIRALWTQGETQPVCSAVEGHPVVDEPVASSCKVCKESVIGKGLCKEKIRLFLLTEIKGEMQPAICTLPPTSIKHWNNHLRRLRRSGLPVIAVNAVFSLQDAKRGSYRWGEFLISIEGCPTLQTLQKAVGLRREYADFMEAITAHDYNEPGDKSEEK